MTSQELGIFHQLNAAPETSPLIGRARCRTHSVRLPTRREPGSPCGRCLAGPRSLAKLRGADMRPREGGGGGVSCPATVATATATNFSTLEGGAPPLPAKPKVCTGEPN